MDISPSSSDNEYYSPLNLSVNIYTEILESNTEIFTDYIFVYNLISNTFEIIKMSLLFD
jgi:hypothetical protein